MFVQWKTMASAMRALLRSRNLRVFTLDGNATQRKSLQQFAQSTGNAVLLLTLDESFAGLHLPHVRHVVFSHAVVSSSVVQLETQAIARCIRPGQRDTVCVHTFVLASTAEETMWRSIIMIVRARCRSASLFAP